MKDTSVHVIFSSVSPVGGNRETRNRHIMHINLASWLVPKGFVFYDYGTCYEGYNLLRVVIHLYRRGKAISGTKLANLAR